MGTNANGIFIVTSYVCLFQNCEGSLKIAKNSAASSVKHAKASALGSALLPQKWVQNTKYNIIDIFCSSKLHVPKR